MVMDGRHLEDALSSPKFVAPHLEDDGKRLNHEDAADEDQQDFLLDQHRYDSEATAERE